MKSYARIWGRLAPWRLSGDNAALMELQVNEFAGEITAAASQYDKFIVCVEKTPDDFRQSLQSLMAKAITAYQTRAAGLHHGIALDKHVTIILSENNGARPLCGIYFNLHSPYQRQPVSQKAR